jgi:hypothetical protein
MDMDTDIIMDTDMDMDSDMDMVEDMDMKVDMDTDVNETKIVDIDIGSLRYVSVQYWNRLKCLVIV